MPDKGFVGCEGDLWQKTLFFSTFLCLSRVRRGLEAQVHEAEVGAAQRLFAFHEYAAKHCGDWVVDGVSYLGRPGARVHNRVDGPGTRGVSSQEPRVTV